MEATLKHRKKKSSFLFLIFETACLFYKIKNIFVNKSAQAIFKIIALANVIK